MSGKALRLTVVSALAFCLILGLGMLPALAESGGGGVSLPAVASLKADSPDMAELSAVSASHAVTKTAAARTARNVPAPAAAHVSAAAGAAHPAQSHGDGVEFAGTIQSIAGSLWTVNNITFTVDISTEIHPSATLAVVGAFVAVEAVRLPDSSLLARQIEVLPNPVGGHERHVEFRGVITSFDANVWMVGGRTVNISPTVTIIVGTPAIGAMAEVEAAVKPDGSLWAVKIQVEKAEVEKQRVEFKGVISAFDANQWVVGGRTVLISTTTQISGTPQIGLIAEVQALKVGSTLTALRIRVVTPEPKEIEFSGRIVTMTATSWTVGSKTFTVDANTQIDQSRGTARVGARVEVQGVILPDLSILAKRIRVVGR